MNSSPMEMAMIAVEPLQLPEVITRVLQYVDMKQRITCCSVVSRVWNEAAGAATTSIHMQELPLSSAVITSLQGWLARHGSHLTKLTSFGNNSLELVHRFAPGLQQLRDLELGDAYLIAALSQGNYSTAFPSLRALKSLALYVAHVHASAVGSLHFLSYLDGLQHLNIRGPIAPPPFIEATIISADLPCVPLSLTSLFISDWHGTVGGSLGTASLLSQLTNLQNLYIDDADARGVPSILLGTNALSSLVQLTSLVYSIYSMYSGTAVYEWSEADTADFLSGVAYLTRLKHLNIHPTLKAASPAVAHYSALTNSNSLIHLNLCQSQVPGGYWEYMLPLGRKFTALKKLDVSKQRVVGRNPWNFTAHIIAACPSLQELSFSCPAREAAQLKQLTQLTGLTSLTVAGEDLNQGFVPALMQLAKLRCLSLGMYWGNMNGDGIEHSGDANDNDSGNAVGGLSNANFVKLHHLTQLTNLCVCGQLCRELNQPGTLWLFREPGLEVWEQLLQCFETLPQLAGVHPAISDQAVGDELVRDQATGPALGCCRIA